MNKAHTNVNWENLPSTNTPLNQQNLNQMDHAIDEIDDRVIVHDNEITQLQGYETRAAQSATAAANSASTASTKATAAATSATNSENFYKYSKSYAVGGTGIRSGEDTDNSKYYYEQVKSMASGGHAIMDSNGTAMAGRSILQFANSRVKDDATNDKTIVAPAHGHTNLLNPTLGTTTVNGVTCTANGDGTYTLSGTATNDVWFNILPNSGVARPSIADIGIKKGNKYRFCGTPNGGSTSTFMMNVYTYETGEQGGAGVNGYVDIGNGLTTNAFADNENNIGIGIRIKSGTPCNNLTFKPMLTTDLSATYDDYVQYSGDGELNQNVASLYEGLESTDANLAATNSNLATTNSNVTAVTTKANNIQSQIVTSGNIESGNTATSAHTVGTYIQWKGKFYVVTAAIAVGDTLAVGTNLTAKTVGDVLTQINADLTDINSNLARLNERISRSIQWAAQYTKAEIGYDWKYYGNFIVSYANCVCIVHVVGNPSSTTSATVTDLTRNAASFFSVSFFVKNGKTVIVFTKTGSNSGNLTVLPLEQLTNFYMTQY